MDIYYDLINIYNFLKLMAWENQKFAVSNLRFLGEPGNQAVSICFADKPSPTAVAS